MLIWMKQFPHENEPDGDSFAPHHYIWGTGVYCLGLMMATEGTLVGNTGVMIGLFGFLFMWPYYHSAGAVMSGVAIPMMAYPIIFSQGVYGISALVALIGVLAVTDDYVSHAFGMSTPLDRIWKERVAGKLQ